jgi:hypothetical protein
MSEEKWRASVDPNLTATSYAASKAGIVVPPIV